MRDLGLEVGDELGQVAVVARGGEVLAPRLPLEREPVRGLQLLQAPSDVGRLAVVVVHGRVGEALVRVGIRALELRDQVIEGRHGGSQGSRRASRKAGRRR